MKKVRAQNALFQAAVTKREDAIPLLLTYGIDMKQRKAGYTEKHKRRRLTVLQIARERGYDEFAQVLINNGVLDETLEPDQSPTPTPVKPVTPQHPDSLALSPGSFMSDNPKGTLDVSPKLTFISI